MNTEKAVVEIVQSEVKTSLNSVQLSTEKPPSQSQDSDKKVESLNKKSFAFHICCCILIWMYLGAFYAIPSATFYSIRQQLHISTNQIGLLWSVYEIMYGISATLTGIIADLKYKLTKFYIAIFIIISIISLSVMHLITNYLVMIIVWSLLSYALGVFDCCNAIFAYKLFINPQHGTIFLTIGTIIAMIMMTAIVPVIDLSLAIFDSYSYSMYLLFIFAVPALILVLVLPVPNTTEHVNKEENKNNSLNIRTSMIRSSALFFKNENSIQQQVAQQSHSELRSPNTIMYALNRQKLKKRQINIFRCLAMCVMAGFQSQNIMYSAYIAVYTINYLKISEQMALYFVTVFFTGMTIGRVATVYLLTKYRADKVILMCNITTFFIGLLFLAFHLLYDKKMITLYTFETILYFILFSAGFLSSPLLNAAYAFLSLIQPISGFANSLLFGGYCIGGATTAYVIGAFVDAFGARVIPMSVVIQLSICLFCGIAIRLKYINYRTKYN
eukprot:554628_1